MTDETQKQEEETKIEESREEVSRESDKSAGPSFAILMQYLKDLSYEGIATVDVYTKGIQENPKVNLGFDVKVNELGGTRYEVIQVIKCVADIGDKPAYIVEMSYAALVEVANIPDEHKGPLLYIEVPRLLFPFVRNIVSEVTRNGNFNSLMISNMDWMSMYRAKLEDAKKQREEGESSVGGAEGESSVGGAEGE